MEVKFKKASFSSRLFAFGADLLLMIITALGLVLAAQAIMRNVPYYKAAGQKIKDIELQTGLYITTNAAGDVYSLADYYKPENVDQYKTYCDDMNNALTEFYKMEQFFSDTEWSQNHYVEMKLDSKLFIYVDETHTALTPVDESEASLKKMFTFYGRTIKEDATLYISKYPGYVESGKTLNLSFVFIILLLPVVLSVSIYEYILPLILKRGRRTIGKLLFKTAVVDARGLTPSFWRFTLRFLFFLIVEVLLSAVAFLIPVIVSFTMYIFNKSDQSLHDYVVGTYVVDCSDNRVFNSEEEFYIAMEKANAINLEEKTVVYDDHGI